MDGVAERFTAGERAHREFESDRREQNRRLLDGYRLGQTSFDPAVLGTGYPDGSRHIDATEATIEPRVAELIENVGRHRSATRGSDIDGAYAATHPGSMTSGGYPAVIEVLAVIEMTVAPNVLA